MQDTRILNFIGDYINAGLREMLSGGFVKRIFLDEDTMKLSIDADFDSYVEYGNIIAAQS